MKLFPNLISCTSLPKNRVNSLFRVHALSARAFHISNLGLSPKQLNEKRNDHELNSMKSLLDSVKPLHPQPITQPNASLLNSANKKKKLRNVSSDEFFASPLQPTESITPRKVAAFSTSQNYDLTKFSSILPQKFSVLPSLADDCMYIQYKATDDIGDLLPSKADAFIFDNGTFVTWGAGQRENDELLTLIKQVEVGGSYGTVETEVFDFEENLSVPGKATSEKIVIGHDLPSHQSKLAFSAGLARSVKLASLENQLDIHLSKNRNIPEILLRGKKLPFNRSSILKNLGELYSLRGHVNLHSELLDPPDFCWSSSKMESYFTSISRELDVSPRISIFNKKLDYANELSELLRNHFGQEHSVSLEVMIIVLISVEIVFEVVSYLDRLGYVEIDRWSKKNVFGAAE